MGRIDSTLREQRLLALANAHFGLLHHDHLEREGLVGAIPGRIRSGRLTRLHEGVYCFGHAALRDEGRWLAAIWACGADAVLSHASAAAFHRMRVEDPEAGIHVSTLRKATSRDGIEVHRVRHLDERDDVFHAHPLRVTSVPRTLVDLADTLTWAEFRAAADRLPYLHMASLRAAQQRAPGRDGAPLVTRLIEADDAHTKSEFERRFLRFLDAHRLPRPDALNEVVAGHKADCVYRERKLVVELDGRAYHERRGQMRADRRRDTDYQVAGFLILRLVWDDLHDREAAATARRTRALLEARRPPGSHPPG